MTVYNVCIEYIITVKECKAYEYQSSSIRRIITNEKYCGLDNSLKYDTGEVPVTIVLDNITLCIGFYPLPEISGTLI